VRVYSLIVYSAIVIEFPKIVFVGTFLMSDGLHFLSVKVTSNNCNTYIIVICKHYIIILLYIP
jgi:hypothetical protein